MCSTVCLPGMPLTAGQEADNTRLRFELNDKELIVAKFDMEQALAVAAIQQLISEWATELDVHNGLHISGLVTEDCSYTVGGTARQGRAAVEKFYQERLARLSAQPGGV